MILNELCRMNEGTVVSLNTLKKDVEEFLKVIDPCNYDTDTPEYAFNAMEVVKYTKHIMTIDKIVEALEKNNPDILLKNKLWKDIHKLYIDCGDGWPDYIDDLTYVKDVFMSCKFIEEQIEVKELNIDVDISNPCAIADAIETVADCLKDAVYLSEVGEDHEWAEACESIDVYKEILKFLTSLVSFV